MDEVINVMLDLNKSIEETDKVLEDVLGIVISNEDSNTNNDEGNSDVSNSESNSNTNNDESNSNTNNDEGNSNTNNSESNSEDESKSYSLKMFTLPEGWKILSKKRKKGMTKGRMDKYWISPSGIRYNSLIRVKRVLKRTVN